MATTVRIRDEDKATLDALQAKMTLAGGKRLPLEEVLHRIVEFAEDHEDELVLDDTPPALTKKQIAAFHKGIGASGAPPLREEDMDDFLYGLET